MKNYKPYKGFYDLRNYELPKKIFSKLWKIQNMLFHMQERYDYFKKWHPGQWAKAKQLSAEYQRILFNYPRRIEE